MKSQSLYDALGWIVFIGIVMLFTMNMCGCGTSKTSCKEPIGPYHIKDPITLECGSCHSTLIIVDGSGWAVCGKCHKTL